MAWLLRLVLPAAIFWLLWRYLHSEPTSLRSSEESGENMKDEGVEIVDICPECGEPIKGRHKC